jgi:hypothetical protein
MTIQQFIEKAVEGGFHPHYIERPEIKHMVYYGHPYPVYVILLDPLAWQAVGKVEEWDEHYLPEDWGQYQHKMHDMIDALTEGKTVEQYLETL